MNATSTTLDPARIKVSSLTVTLEDLPVALFAPATAGFKAPIDYTWNLWPRVGVGANNQLTDFAPDAANQGLQVTAVPEPASWALLVAGLGLVGLRLARRDPGAAVSGGR